jgi:hypothetical protein
MDTGLFTGMAKYDPNNPFVQLLVKYAYLGYLGDLGHFGGRSIQPAARPADTPESP